MIFQQGDGINNPSPSQRWNVIESVKGVYGHEDCVNDIAEIKFDRPIAIKVNDNELFSTDITSLVHQDEVMLKIFGH